jgi:hypothetical protein
MGDEVLLRKIRGFWPGVLVLNRGGADLQTRIADIDDGTADLIAVASMSLANPDLVGYRNLRRRVEAPRRTISPKHTDVDRSVPLNRGFRLSTVFHAGRQLRQRLQRKFNSARALGLTRTCKIGSQQDSCGERTRPSCLLIEENRARRTSAESDRAEIPHGHTLHASEH